MKRVMDSNRISPTFYSNTYFAAYAFNREEISVNVEEIVKSTTCIAWNDTTCPRRLIKNNEEKKKKSLDKFASRKLALVYTVSRK